MTNYLVTIIVPADRFDIEVKADYTMDAVNTVLDDLYDDHLVNLTDPLTIIAKVQP